MDETDKSMASEPHPWISEVALALYVDMLAGARVATKDTPGLLELEKLKMVMPKLLEPTTYTALAPRHIERLWQQRLLDEITTRADRLRRLPDFIGDLSRREQQRHTESNGAPSGELLEGHHLDAGLEYLIHGAKEEICTAMPGGPRPDVVGTLSESREIAAMRRKVHWRTVYEESAKNSGGAPHFARRVTELGGEVRTTHLPFLRMILVDRTAALLPCEPAHSDTGAPRAWLVRDPASVQFARMVFELTWQLAAPWTLTDPVTTPIQRSIIRGLLSGATQNAVAKGLELHPSTASGHLNDLIRKLNLQNREQLIAWWCSSDDREIP